jgi:drug/metabolite transporter (DMT)-like permease
MSQPAPARDQRPAPRKAAFPGQGPGQVAGTSFALAAVLMWGLAPVATRALVLRLAPLPLLVLRVSIALVILLPLAIPILRLLDRRSALRLVAAGLLGLVGYNLPLTLGLRWVHAATAALILGTEPVWILAMSRVFLREPVPGWSWGGAAIAGAGVAVIAGPGALPGGGSSAVGSTGLALAGIALVLLGTALFAAYTIVLRPLSARFGPVRATAASTVAGVLPYLLCAGTVSPDQVARLPAAAWGELIFLAVGCTVGGLLLFSLAVVRIGPARAGLLLYAEPLAGVAGAVWFLGERPPPAVAAGGLLVMAGVGIAWAAQRRQVS